MKNFVQLIQKVHNMNFMALSQKLVHEKIPVTFLTYSVTDDCINFAQNYKNQGLNIPHIITVTPPPEVNNTDFKIININEINESHLNPEYILPRTLIDYKFAKKFFPKAKIFLMWVSPQVNYDAFMNHLTELQEVYESLIDEDSKKAFCGYWLANVSCLLSEAVHANTSQYICHGFIPKAGDVFIDCGTCDGSTALRFSKMGCKVYGFEMDKKNFEIAKKLSDENGFSVENLGLGSFKHDMRYSHVEGNIGASRLDTAGSETTKIITLDSYIAENKIPHVDFIKMDVEGAELDILKGATTTIARCKPILALSAYHKIDDFWTLMNFVKSIRPDYEFALRHYASSREDVPFLFDENTETFLDSFGMDVTLPGYTECVLFAR